MKSLVILLVFISQTTFARQYIQCSAIGFNSDRIVINLDDDDSTLYLTNGVHIPNNERLHILKKLSYSFTDAKITEYIAEDELTKEYVQIPSSAIGKASNYFEVTLFLERLSDNYTVEIKHSCFSSIYN